MNKINTITIGLLGLFIALPVSAGAMGDDAVNNSSFYVGAYGGYGQISGGYDNDGETAQGRFALGLNLKEYQHHTFGAELGIQSGNTMRLNADADLIEVAGGLPIQSTLKPIIDLLATVKGQFNQNSSFYYLLKGGIAYRQLQLDNRTSAQDSIQNAAGEFQAGLGYKLAPHVTLTAFYQGIYSSNSAQISLNNILDVTVDRIPTQQAGFIGVEYALF